MDRQVVTGEMVVMEMISIVASEIVIAANVFGSAVAAEVVIEDSEVLHLTMAMTIALHIRMIEPEGIMGRVILVMVSYFGL